MLHKKRHTVAAANDKQATYVTSHNADSEETH